MLGLIILIILGLISIFFWLGYWLPNRELIRRFKDNNVIVFGRKGKGKDLLFQYVIKHRKKEQYASNITYGYNNIPLKLKNLSLYPNTFENLLNENIEKLPNQPFEDGTDIYISDAGNYFPSQYDYLLHKYYKSNPLYYSLCRHISDNNIHCNAQNLERIWKALREQADTYVWCYKRIKILKKFIVVKYIIYDKYETAKQEVMPIKTTLRKAVKDQKIVDQSHLGYMKSGWFIIRTKKIKYNTRAFRDIFIEDKPK